MTDRQALLSAAGKQRPYKAVNIKPPAMPGDIYCFIVSSDGWNHDSLQGSRQHKITLVTQNNRKDYHRMFSHTRDYLHITSDKYKLSEVLF